MGLPLIPCLVSYCFRSGRETYFGKTGPNLCEAHRKNWAADHPDLASPQELEAYRREYTYIPWKGPREEMSTFPDNFRGWLDKMP